jgi:L-aspartate oxidase
MAARMTEQGVDHLWLDATGLERFPQRFPTIAASLREINLDPSTDWLPIAPAAHHLSGGVLTDLWGATAMPGLWAAGEVACSGVHGANRLASNSLLEGMVFGARLAERIKEDGDPPEPSGALSALVEANTGGDHIACRLVAADPPPVSDASPDGLSDELPDESGLPDLAKLRDQLQRALTSGAGVVRSAQSLASAQSTVAEIRSAILGVSPSVGVGELANLLAVADGLLESALIRCESRGAHTRAEYPDTEEAWRLRLVHGAVRRQHANP